MEMMESLVRPEPVDFVYDPVPLMRLLSRAVYADAVVPLEQASRKVDEFVRKADAPLWNSARRLLCHSDGSGMQRRLHFRRPELESIYLELLMLTNWQRDGVVQ